MTIKELLDAEIGTVFTDFDVTIKTCKKIVQRADKKWVQQIVIIDETGDALVHVMLYQYIPLVRNTTLHVIRLIVQSGVPEAGDKTDKKLYIERSVTPTDIGEPPELGSISEVSDQITRSKIKHGLTCAYIQSGKTPDKAKINDLVNFIME